MCTVILLCTYTTNNRSDTRDRNVSWCLGQIYHISVDINDITSEDTNIPTYMQPLHGVLKYNIIILFTGSTGKGK